MNLCHIYSDHIPDFLLETAATAPMIRLQDIGMNCGCEYTKFPMFNDLPPYSRYDHSLGVGLIIWHFLQSQNACRTYLSLDHIRAQALAGLLHDIATPAFAHVIDFLKGDHLSQESTEDGTRQMIEESFEIQRILSEYGLSTDDVCDYHKYPIADNDTPQLSADRLEYTLGNLVNYGFRSEAEVQALYNDLTVGKNESGQDEIMFRTPDIALDFSEGVLQCSEIYVADADRFAMQALADLLREAVNDAVISEQDFYLTEQELIRKLIVHPGYLKKWTEYCSYSKMYTAKQPYEGKHWMKVFAKKRYIDSFISGYGRVSQIYPEFSEKLQAFLEAAQDYWICGE